MKRSLQIGAAGRVLLVLLALLLVLPAGAGLVCCVGDCGCCEHGDDAGKAGFHAAHLDAHCCCASVPEAPKRLPAVPASGDEQASRTLKAQALMALHTLEAPQVFLAPTATFAPPSVAVFATPVSQHLRINC